MSCAKKQSAALRATLATLAALPIERLRAQYEHAFEKPAGKQKRDHLVRALAERATGMGGETKHASASAPTTPAKPTSKPRKPAARKRDERLPAPNTVLRRECKGRQVEVKVLADGFEWKGERFKSLSAIATKAYGCPANGFLFFGLIPKPTKPEAPKPPTPTTPAKRKAGRPIAPRRSK